MGCNIIGCGKALPERVVTNDEMSSIVDTSDEWIVTRTGIEERRVAVSETATDLGVAAARRALGIEEGGWRPAGAEPVDPASIDLLVCMTISGDVVVPSQAAMLRAALGLSNAVAFDLNAACSGCVYGLDVASQMLEVSALAAAAEAQGRPVPHRNAMRRALVVGTERLTRLVDWTDRATCVLFGDGAGAVVLEWQEGADGILSSFLKNADDVGGVLTVANAFDMTTFPFGGALEATGADTVAVATLRDDAERAMEGLERYAEGYEGATTPFIVMQGQAVFKFASSAMAEAANAVLARAGVAIDEVKCIVPHQANERIIKYAAKKLGVGMERFQVSLASVGNTSASSVLMALADAYLAGRIEPGDLVMLVGFGGGLTSGALLYRA